MEFFRPVVFRYFVGWLILVLCAQSSDPFIEITDNCLTQRSESGWFDVDIIVQDVATNHQLSFMQELFLNFRHISEVFKVPFLCINHKFNAQEETCCVECQEVPDPECHLFYLWRILDVLCQS